MAKVRINKLPPGFRLVDGKIVQDEQPNMQMGGYVTGDQMNYGLVTVPSNVNNEQMSDSQDADVRYSLSSVPRDEANIEAEGGETVLTDLNQDGNFGLYDIKGPRHSSGGVPMYLPDQSFVFSDTKDMKFNKSEMAEFGIESRKKQTPAKISKKYDLNKYYGAIDDEYADDIQVRSAELMIDKNQRDLSKLAFAQEMKKDFEDGVPLASHPYLISIGEDPVEFTAKVEEISKQKAMMKALAALPPEEQMKVLALQQMLAQAQQQPAAPQGPAMPGAPQGVMPPADPAMDPMSMPALPELQSKAKYGLEMYQGGKEKKGEKKEDGYSSYDPVYAEQLRQFGIGFDQSGYPSTEYDLIQSENEEGLYGPGKSNLEVFAEKWKDLYPNYDALMAVLNTGVGEDPEIEKFQRWYNEEYTPDFVEQVRQAEIDAGRKFTQQQAKQLEKVLIEGSGFSSIRPDRDIDSRAGGYFTTRAPYTYKTPEKKEVVEEVTKERPDLDIPDVGREKALPSPEFWKQDLLKMNAIAQRNRRLGLPFQPAVTPVDIDYTLEDPTRAIAAIAEQKNIGDQAMAAFSGPQAGSARIAGTTGKAMKAVADATAGVQARNVQTANRADYQQAAMDYKTEALQRAAKVKEYDDTEKALQAYMDEKNFDREQYAQAYMDALTNRANTYNLNLMQDYFNVGPSAGGMISQVDSRAFDAVKSPDRSDQYMEYLDRLKKTGIEDSKALISGANTMLGMQSNVDPFETNIQRQMKQNPYLQYGYPTQKRGGEKKLKKYAVPFYTGKTGM